MKRIAALAGAGALLLSMAGPAFGGFDWFGSDSSLTVNNHALVINKTETEAETGDNESSGGWIMTGNAGATSLVGNQVNYTEVWGCDCYDDVTVNNGAFVYNDTETEAETGDNDTGGSRRRRHRSSGGAIFTGNAGATSVVENLVNFTLIGY